MVIKTRLTRDIEPTKGRSIIMRKWEYKIVDSNDVPSAGIFKGRQREALEAYLNELGAEGWELVNID